MPIRRFCPIPTIKITLQIMSTRHGRNFTGFQNIHVKGSGTTSPQSVGMIDLEQGVTNTGSTISVQMLSGSTVNSENGSVEHPYFHISNAGLSIGTGHFRISSTTGKGTLAFGTTQDSDYAWKLPSMTGGLPVCGTFTINLPGITGGSFSETNVAVTGIRADSAFVCTLQDTFNTVTTERTQAMLVGAAPGNGYVHLTFSNPHATATIYNTLVAAYAMFR